MANLDSIPTELVSMIFDHVSTCNCDVSCKCGRGMILESTFSLRLTSKKFALIGAKHIVETIHLCFRKKSFENLANISNHETLRGHVKRIIYDANALGFMSRKTWERCIPIPRHTPLPPGVRCMNYDEAEGVEYMPGKHWERCYPTWPSNFALPSDVIVPPYAYPPNFESELLDHLDEASIPVIVAYNSTRQRLMKKLIPRLVYSEEELENGYECYKKEVLENTLFLLSTNHDYTILAAALKTFLHLKEVNIVLLRDESRRSEDLRAAFQHTLVFPHKLPRRVERTAYGYFDEENRIVHGYQQAESMLRAIASAGVQLKALTCGYLLWEFFLESSPDASNGLGQISPELFLPAFIHLTRIELSLNAADFEASSRAKDSTIGKALASAQSLTSLILSFNWDYDDGRNRVREDLLPITWDHIAATTTWPHLTELSLNTIAFAECFWLDFLQRHSTTLVSLKLAEVTLLKGNWFNTFPRMKAIVEGTSVLRSAKLIHGFLHSEDTNGMRVDEKGFDMSFSHSDDDDPEDTLGTRIANYLIHDHENPLDHDGNNTDENDDPAFPMDIYSYDVLDDLRDVDIQSDRSSVYSYDEMDLESLEDPEANHDMDCFREEVEEAKASLRAQIHPEADDRD